MEKVALDSARDFPVAEQLAVAGAASPSARYGWFVVAALALVYTLSYADRMMLSLLIRPIKQDLGLTDVEVSLLIGIAFALFYAVLGLPFGILSDKVHRRNLILAGIASWSLMTGSCAMAGSFGALFAGRIGVGIGEASLSPAAYSIIGDYFSRDRLGRAISVYTLGIPVGSGLALVFGGAIVQLLEAAPVMHAPLFGALASWRVALLCMALLGVPFLAIVMTIREPHRHHAGRTAEVPVGETMAFVRSNATLMLFHFVGVGVFSAVFFGMMAWLPTFFTRTYGMPTGQAGVYFGIIIGLGGIAGLVGAGVLGDLLFRRGQLDGHLLVLAIGAIFAFPFLAAVPFAPSARWAFWLLMPVSLGWATSYSLSTTILQLYTPSRLRGRITAAFLLVTNVIGLGLGPTLVALITDKVLGDESQLRWSLAIFSVGMPVAAALLVLAMKPMRRSLSVSERTPAPLPR